MAGGLKGAEHLLTQNEDSMKNVDGAGFNGLDSRLQSTEGSS